MSEQNNKITNLYFTFSTKIKVLTKLDSKTRNTSIMFVMMIIFKISMELGYWYILCQDKTIYTADFNLSKYINGMLWCIILFSSINYEELKASTFFIYFKFILEIIPITIIYSLGNDSFIYYNTVCFAFLICILIVKNYNVYGISLKLKYLPFFSKIVFIVLVTSLFINILLKNGLPTLQALNIYEVYELRKSGGFQVSKYMGYVLGWSSSVILPFFIAKTLYHKEYFKAIIPSFLLLVTYFYTGHKTILFSIPLVMVCTLWSKRNTFLTEFFPVLCIGGALSQFQ